MINFENIYNESVEAQKVADSEKLNESEKTDGKEKLQEATFFATCLNDNGLPFDGMKKPDDKSNVDAFVGKLNL